MIETSVRVRGCVECVKHKLVGLANNCRRVLVVVVFERGGLFQFRMRTCRWDSPGKGLTVPTRISNRCINTCGKLVCVPCNTPLFLLNAIFHRCHFVENGESKLSGRNLLMPY